MINPIIVFDVSHDMTDTVVTHMLSKGYYKKWESNGKMYLLPRNMIWKKEGTIEEALGDLRICINEIKSNYVGASGVKLLRCIVLNSSPWGGICGEESGQKTLAEKQE